MADEPIKLEDILKEVTQNPSSALKTSYWFNMTPDQIEYYKKAEIVYSNLPPDVYTLQRMVDVGKAVMSIEGEAGTKTYVEDKGVVDRFNSKMKEVEWKLRRLRKEEQKKPGKNKAQIEELENEQRLLNAYYDTAVTLASYLMAEVKIYNDATASEDKRNKGKITHIEEDKNLAVNSIKAGKNIAQKTLDLIVKAAPTGGVAAAATYGIPGEAYIKLVWGIVAAVLTYFPINTIIAYVEDKRMYTAQHSQDNNFTSEDKLHIAVKTYLTTDHDKTCDEICQRAVAKLAFEVERYFPDAVILPPKDMKPEELEQEAKKMSEDLTTLVDSRGP